MAFLAAPRNFVQPYKPFVRNSIGNKTFNRFNCSLKNRSVNLIEWNISVCLVESPHLRAPKIIQAAVNAAALNNAFQVKIGLAVPYNVYFFRVQFCANLAPVFVPGGGIYSYKPLIGSKNIKRIDLITIYIRNARL